MATLLKSGALFLHVPKTGGNWVRDVLESHGLVFAHVGGKHAGRRQLAPLLDLLDTPRRYARPNRALLTFCFVRHPLRWYESWYRMNVALDWPEWAADEAAWNPSVELNGLRADTFNRFVELVLGRHPGFVTALYDYYAADSHVVGRQEHAVDDLVRVLRLLRVPVTRDDVQRHRPVNVSRRAPVELDSTLRAALEAAERGALERYGYAPADQANLRAIEASLTPGGGRIALSAPFLRDAGVAWRVELPQLARFADTDSGPERSLLQLFEDGRPLPIAHAPHADIRSIGEGRFSHWHTTLLFAASDNTDPNHNRRAYEVGWSVPAGRDLTHLVVKPAEPLIGAAL